MDKLQIIKSFHRGFIVCKIDKIKQREYYNGYNKKQRKDMTVKVTSKTVSEVLAENSKHTEEIILHLHYDQIDEKNHKSQKTISHLMGEAGFHEIGQVIEEHKNVVYISEPEYALHAHNFLNEHSAAIGSTVYYKGYHATKAEEFLLKTVKNNKEKS